MYVSTMLTSGKNFTNFSLISKGTAELCYRTFTKKVPAPQLPTLSGYAPPEYKGLSYDELLRIRKTNLNPVLKTYYQKPLLLSSGHMQWLFDHTGKRYLDMFGGIVTVSVGHCHPTVTAAMHKQGTTLGHCTNIYLHEKIHEYAEKLTSKLPGDLKVVYFVNSGSEANDLAILMARLYTKNHEILSLRNGYHGLTNQVMGIVSSSGFKYPVPTPSGIHHVMNPDVYRGEWGGSACRDSPVQTVRDCACGPAECRACDGYVRALEEVVSYSVPRHSVAAMFVESIQGVGGIVQYPRGYVKRAAEIVRGQGGLFVADEVQTGFGRTGEHFWGFEGHGIVPDIVTMAKGIGNGYPLGAVVTTPDIAQALAVAAHFNTFGGNPVACATGLAVLEVIEKENTQQRCVDVGTPLLHKLAKLRDEFDCIGDIRGKGLMIGIEMVEDKKNKTPMTVEHIMSIWEDCRDMGLLLGKGGHFGNVYRIQPPMCITTEDADFTVDVLKTAIQRFYSKSK